MAASRQNEHKKAGLLINAYTVDLYFHFAMLLVCSQQRFEFLKVIMNVVNTKAVALCPHKPEAF